MFSGLGRSPGEGHDNPLQYSGLENSMGCIWGHKESDATEQLFSLLLYLGFPAGAAVKNPPANTGDARDMGSIPGAGIGYPLQYSWASLVAQLVKNIPALQETWV